MLPAYAGMIREFAGWANDGFRAPRVCGDDPDAMMMLGIQAAVLPAYAGMIPETLLHHERPCRAPRVCGDDPPGAVGENSLRRCSPRMRG